MRDRSQRRSIILGQKPDGALPNREYMRLLIYFGLAAVVTVGALAAIRSLGGEGEERRSIEVVIPENRLTPGAASIENIPVDVSEWRPPVDVINAEVRETTRIDRVKSYPRALNALAVAARNRPYVHFRLDPVYGEVGGFEIVPPATLADPAKSPELRARPVEVSGKLVAIEAVLPELEYGLDPREFPTPRLHGIIESGGEEVKFLMLHDVGEDSRESAEIDLPQVGERYKVQGVFFRVVEEPRTKGSEEYVLRPIVLGKKIAPLVPLELEETLAPDLAERIAAIESDPRTLARTPHRDTEFYELIGYILAHGNAALPAGVEPLSMSGRRTLDHPEDYRLKPVTVRGQVIYLAWESFEYEAMRPEDAPIQGYWHAIVADGNVLMNAPVSLVIPHDDLPAEITTWIHASEQERLSMQPPLMAVEGIYYRVHSYMARGDSDSGRVPVRLPLVVAVSPIRMLEPAQPDDFSGFFTVFFGVAGALVIVLVVMLVRDKSRAQASESVRRAHRVERRKSRGMDLNRPTPGSPGEPPKPGASP